jgi:hypothetical protein
MSPSELLYFLKMGGSLITDKTTPRTPRMEVLNRLAMEIASACAQNPSLHLVVGNGAGSFGHVPARRGTRNGHQGCAACRGVAWAAASNRLRPMPALPACLRSPFPFGRYHAGRRRISRQSAMPSSDCCPSYTVMSYLIPSVAVPSSQKIFRQHLAAMRLNDPAIGPKRQ